MIGADPALDAEVETFLARRAGQIQELGTAADTGGSVAAYRLCALAGLYAEVFGGTVEDAARALLVSAGVRDDSRELRH